MGLLMGNMVAGLFKRSPRGFEAGWKETLDGFLGNTSSKGGLPLGY